MGNLTSSLRCSVMRWYIIIRRYQARIINCISFNTFSCKIVKTRDNYDLISVNKSEIWSVFNLSYYQESQMILIMFVASYHSKIKHSSHVWSNISHVPHSLCYSLILTSLPGGWWGGKLWFLSWMMGFSQKIKIFT